MAPPVIPRPASSPETGPSTGAQEIALQALIGAEWMTASTIPFPRLPRTPAITVFIPAHNEAATIGHTLQSLQQQSLRPARIIVVADNCTDDTATIATRYGAGVFATRGNRAKKAGALNQALTRVLPELPASDLVLVMDADSQLTCEWLGISSRMLARWPMVGAVCGVFLGEPGAGLVGQLQRNEYIRYARTVQRRPQAPVLSGTGTLFRVSALREVARERGRRLPGRPGEFYSTMSITEDDEITLALKTLGHRCMPALGCHTTTEVMPTWRDLWTQRVRWQKGALADLRAYGISRVTTFYWLRQTGIYAGLIASLFCWAIIIAEFTHQPGFNWTWTGAILGINFIERLWTVRRGGWRGMFLSMLMAPEFAYDVFRMGVFIWSIVAAVAHLDIAWGHLARETAG